MPCILSAHDISSLYPVGIATIDTHRTLKKKEKTSLSYSKWTLKATLCVKLSNVNQTSERLVTEGCSQIHAATVI